MTDATTDWERRIAATWESIDDCDPDAFVASIGKLAAERPPGDANATFEHAAAFDSTGRPDLAVPLYRSALDAGLQGIRRRRAVIQMSSSLRNLGEPQRAVDLLSAELEAADDELTGAVRAFLALALVDVGREREATAVALEALSKYLPRYNRSLARYAQDLANKNQE